MINETGSGASLLGFKLWSWHLPAACCGCATLSHPASVSTSVMVSMLWALAPGVGIAEFSLGNRWHVELTMELGTCELVGGVGGPQGRWQRCSELSLIAGGVSMKL